MVFRKVNDLYLATNIFYPVLYADDTTLITSISTTGDNSDETINKELKNVNDLLKLNKLSLNTSKSNGVLQVSKNYNISQFKF